MKKEIKTVGSEKFFLDQCNACNLTWFDSGKLEKFQLQYENSEQGIERFRFRERFDSIC
jgi:Zn-finger nucleic acid-binding protein